MLHVDMKVSEYAIAHMLEGIGSQQDWISSVIDDLLLAKGQRRARGEEVTDLDDRLSECYAHSKELRIAWDALNAAR